MPADTFDAVDHADGSVLGSFQLAREDDVRAALDAARDVVPRWAGARVGERARTLRDWRGELWRTSSQLAGVFHRESGVPFDEALVEVLQVVEHLRWVEQNAARVLDSRSVPRGRFTPELDVMTASVPEGVVGVVAAGRPSLYALTSAVACALVAGNPVVVAPQRRLAATVVAVAEAFATAHRDAPSGLFQVLTGDDETALALAGAPFDRLAFLGTPVAAVRVATTAARALVPLTVVPVVAPVTLVAPDADLAVAASAVVAAARAGDPGDPASAPDVFVAPSVIEEFRAALTAATTRSADRPRRALARALGRRASGPAELASPTVEVRVQTAPGFDVLVERLRDHPSAQVAVHSQRHGKRLAELLSAAEVTVNLGAASTDGLPRAALGARGYGPFSGDDGLRTFARTRTTTGRRRLPVPVAPVEALLATPAGRIATRLALHVRHSL